jgi:hypothetical protein
MLLCLPVINCGKTLIMYFAARLRIAALLFQTFHLHLQKQQTPDIMATLTICNIMHSWINHTRFFPPDWHPPEEPIMQALHQAFQAQHLIRWDQFFCGHFALKWRDAIMLYYRKCNPGPAFTPDHWMRSTIKAIWTFALMLWCHHNSEYHGEHITGVFKFLFLIIIPPIDVYQIKARLLQR